MQRIEKVIFFEINFSFVGQQASHAAFTEYNLFRCSGCVTERVLNGCGQETFGSFVPPASANPYRDYELHTRFRCPLRRIFPAACSLCENGAVRRMGFSAQGPEGLGVRCTGGPRGSGCSR